MLSESTSISDNDFFGESFGITRVDISWIFFVFDIHHLLLLSISNQTIGVGEIVIITGNIIVYFILLTTVYDVDI